MIKNEKMWSRTGWWRMGLRLSLVSVLSVTLALGSILATPSPVQAAEWRVSNPCVGCTHTSIQAAINAASSGDTIKVAQGTYYENLTVNKAVNLLGGYSTADWTTRGPASSTVINGSGSSNSVIRVYANATIDNFTITGGSGYFVPFLGGYTIGGGIFAWVSSPTISNNIIQGNSANWGGGILCGDSYNAAGQTTQILNNTISGNTAVRTTKWGWGGGISVSDTSAYIKGNTISDNLAYWGGGLLLGGAAVPTIVEGNIITGNRALGGDGVGGAFFIEDSSVSIKNNVIANNVAQAYADGIYIKKYATTPPQSQIINNTIVANGTDEGILVRDLAPIIRNNIVALNGYGIRHQGWGNPVMSNNDVWGNSVADYSGLLPGTNYISADPLFVNQGGGDYHLQGDSPCIDRGTSSNAPPTDFEGDTRPLDGNGDGSTQYDIGADEYIMPVSIVKRASHSTPDPGDMITYIITYRNNDAATATGVVVTDLLSSNLLNPNATSSGASITRRGGTSYVWDVENLSSGSGGTITITAQVEPSVVTPTAILNTAEFYAVETGSFSDDAPLVVGGLKTYLPLILRSY